MKARPWCCGYQNRCLHDMERTGWTFEPKLDGFCCMICTHTGFRARSRRGMLPEGVQLDGELVAIDQIARPDFHRLSSRMLHGRAGIAVIYLVFDVFAVDGVPTPMNPYEERRALPWQGATASRRERREPTMVVAKPNPSLRARRNLSAGDAQG